MTERVAVDWAGCQGRGVCSELLPERIELDEWGYPVLDPTPVTPDLQGFARNAVDACPTRALRLQRVMPGQHAARPQVPTRSTPSTAPHRPHHRGDRP